MKTLTEEDKVKGWKSIEEKEAFDKYYKHECTKCHSVSCIVKGGFKNPCFIRLDGSNDLLIASAKTER